MLAPLIIHMLNHTREVWFFLVYLGFYKRFSQFQSAILNIFSFGHGCPSSSSLGKKMPAWVQIDHHSCKRGCLPGKPQQSNRLKTHIPKTQQCVCTAETFNLRVTDLCAVPEWKNSIKLSSHPLLKQQPSTYHGSLRCVTNDSPTKALRRHILCVGNRSGICWRTCNMFSTTLITLKTIKSLHEKVKYFTECEAQFCAIFSRNAQITPPSILFYNYGR